MKAAIYNPYLDTLGGGERYTLSFAKILVDKGFRVDIQWKSKDILEVLEKRFGMNLKGISVVDDIKRGDGYDLCFWVSDGSVPALRSRNNILHFQVPFRNVNGRSLINKMKFFRINSIVCNSDFTKGFIDDEFGVNSIVIYPPVAVDDIKSKKKEKIILNVSRFSRLLQSKHQEVLVNVFKRFFDHGNSDWRLLLVGGNEVGDGGYTEELKKISEGYPVDVVVSPGFKFIKEMYGKAKIFWSASGFGINEHDHPESVEHFGITVVEAMSGGVVPFVYNAGGHKEIIKNKENGFLWNTENELLRLTSEVVNNKKLLKTISEKGAQDCHRFSYKAFEDGFNKII